MDLEFVDEVDFGFPISCNGFDPFVGDSMRYGADIYVADDGSLVAYASSRNVEPVGFFDDTICGSQWTP